MKEITTVPVKISNGNFEVFEYEDGFCMTTEFLGRLLGFKRPKEQMSRILRRHKDVLDPYRFVAFEGYKIGGNKLRLNATYSDRGRPSFFYDLRGCERVAAFAQTEQSDEVYVKISDLRSKLEAERLARIEAYWFSVRPWWPEIRDRVMKGENFRQIAEAIGRSAASVRNAVRRMIEVGILLPSRAAQALAGRAKRTVLNYGRKYYGDSRQQLLPGFEA